MLVDNTVYELHHDGWEEDPRYWIHSDHPNFYKATIVPNERRLSDIEVVMLGIDLLDIRDGND